MTHQQLEQRVVELEQQLRSLAEQVRPLISNGNWRKTFGIFAEDEDFDDILRFGREYREEENRQTN